MTEQRSPTTLSAPERQRRQKAVDYARGSVRLEGFIIDDDIVTFNQRYVNGELSSEELTRKILRAAG